MPAATVGVSAVFGISASAPSAVTRLTTGAFSSFVRNLTSLGLGYTIAIAFGFIVLLSAIVLASYACYRASRSPNPPTYPSNGVVLPRVAVVAAEDDDNDEEQWASLGSSALGLDVEVISSYPTFPFSAAAEADKDHEDNVCAICLGEYKEGEALRMMPECRHCFHRSCVDAWLRLNASCPVCRSSPVPTPLSELVPPSELPAGHQRR